MNQQEQRFSVHLDAMRGVAALAVVLYHIRFRFFLDYTEVSPSLLARGFYVLTAFGHDAVIVFFVLSGYLIAGSVFKDLVSGRWSWSRYLLHRGARLYVVLVPGLVLTAAWDILGLTWFGQSSSYTGVRLPWITDYFDVRAHLSAAAFWGNLFFMQRVLVPTFGSNVPLWSLAFEVAYYILFPFALIAVWRNTPLAQRVAYSLVVVTLGLLYGSEIVFYGLIWLLGFGVWLLPPLHLPVTRLRWVWSAMLPVTLVTAVALSHTETIKALTGHSVWAADVLTGIATALCLVLLRGDSGGQPSAFWRRWASSLSGISYTLYIVHFPALVFLRAAFDQGKPWDLNMTTALASLALTALMVLYAFGVWSVSEAHTVRVREFIRTSLRASRPLA